jgi:hypothetical protein
MRLRKQEARADQPRQGVTAPGRPHAQPTLMAQPFSGLAVAQKG